MDFDETLLSSIWRIKVLLWKVSSKSIEDQLNGRCEKQESIKVNIDLYGHSKHALFNEPHNGWPLITVWYLER